MAKIHSAIFVTMLLCSRVTADVAIPTKADTQQKEALAKAKVDIAAILGRQNVFLDYYGPSNALRVSFVLEPNELKNRAEKEVEVIKAVQKSGIEFKLLVLEVSCFVDGMLDDHLGGTWSIEDVNKVAAKGFDPSTLFTFAPKYNQIWD